MSGSWGVPWTQERRQKVIDLAAQGYSAAQIAAELGDVTRNAVIGIIGRMNDSGRHGAVRLGCPKEGRPPTKPAAERKASGNYAGGLTASIKSKRSRAKARADQGVAQRINSMDRATPVPQFTDEASDMAIDPAQRKQLVELEACHCRWPVGRPATAAFFFCGATGADITIGIPYCPSHMARAGRGAPVSASPPPSNFTPWS